MNTKEFVDSLIGYLCNLKAGGQSLVPMEGLINNLAVLQKIIGGEYSPVPPEKLAELQASFDLESYRAEVQAEANLFHSVISTATEAIKSLFLINGGGCVALLALMGQLGTRGVAGSSISPQMFAAPLLAFGIGLAMAATASCFLNLGQAAYHRKRTNLGNCLKWANVVFGAASLVAFLTGCLEAIRKVAC
jgi:hypothetical protein